ncbi:MAG: hypothetical protein LBN06_00045 [Prevotellaceae bacterium]|jgi:hypothetical protein|nr:hypothetical protein [Prevotellaceae bacterium]
MSISICGHAQEDLDQDILIRKIAFIANELQPKDSTFIIKLKTLLFEDYEIYHDKATMHKTFSMRIDKIDSIKYRLYVMYDKEPAWDKINGYYKDGDIFIFIGGNRDLFISLYRKRKYSYTILIATFDPPYWVIEYNIKNSSLTTVEHIALW